ncbi:MAG: DUF3883 domain-containing protein [Alphaproteobacteria bacterium]|nr:MAG: DUF3883 domain-containing protein [Alphaproteobacteria bacterium]
MANDPWTDTENDLIVADYFAMLAKDLSGQSYSKSEHRRQLQPLLQGRSEGSIEFKHQNISAVLMGGGEPWILGYKPAGNFQASLEDAIVRFLERAPVWNFHQAGTAKAPKVHDGASLFIGAAPTLSNQPTPENIEQMRRIARKFDPAGRDARNRALGRAGEELVLEYERATLTNSGRGDLAKRLRWVSDLDGDGAGYDIASFEPDGRPRLIEVKTTKSGWNWTPFHITRNELAVADERRDEWCLVRVWDYMREPKAFELRPPLDRHVSLTATNFQASFQ